MSNENENFLKNTVKIKDLELAPISDLNGEDIDTIELHCMDVSA